MNQFSRKAHQSEKENFQIQYCLGLETCRQYRYILYNFARKLHKKFVIDTSTSSFYGKQTKHAKYNFDGDLKVPEKTLLLLGNGLNL